MDTFLVFSLCFTSWVMLGFFGSNLLWICNHMAGKIRPERYTEREYLRGLVLAVLLGPFAVVFALYKAWKYDMEELNG